MQILGDKKLYKSMTAWGTFLYVLGGGIVESATNAGFLTPEGGAMISGFVAQAGVILGALGIRRALPGSGGGE